MEMNIKVYYQTLKELHGNTVTDEAIFEIIADDLSIDPGLVYKTLEGVKPNHIPVKEYGLVIGRFQPFHYGHQHIINEVLLDGKVPLIILGNDLGKNPKRNPLSVVQRAELIKLIYPHTEIICVGVKDNEDWTQWFDDIGHAVVGTSGRTKEQVTLYYNNKEVDRYDHFEVLGKEYINEFYTKVFEDNGIKTQQVEFVERTDIHIDADATNIRDNFKDFKHLLDARVYHKLKEWGW